MRSLQHLLLAFSLALTSLAVESQFFNPPNNSTLEPTQITYTLNESLTIEWETDSEYVILSLYQFISDYHGDAHNPVSGLILGKTSVKKYTWLVGFGDIVEDKSTLIPSLMNSSRFYLRLLTPETADLARTRSFNMTSAESQSSPASSPSLHVSSITPLTTLSTSSSSSSSSKSTSNSTSTHDSNRTISGGGIAGIVAGVIFFIIIFAWSIRLLLSRSSSTARQSMPPPSSGLGPILEPGSRENNRTQYLELDDR